MAVIYHYSPATISSGAPYYGSNRGYLSWLMGGTVGFGYGFLPEEWKNKKVYRLVLPDDEPVFMSKNGNIVPRMPGHYYKPPIDWDESCILVTAKEAVRLSSDPLMLEKYDFGEVVFLAASARFI